LIRCVFSKSSDIFASPHAVDFFFVSLANASVSCPSFSKSGFVSFHIDGELPSFDTAKNKGSPLNE
jgi:hypothetical protein